MPLLALASRAHGRVGQVIIQASFEGYPNCVVGFSSQTIRKHAVCVIPLNIICDLILIRLLHGCWALDLEDRHLQRA